MSHNPKLNTQNSLHWKERWELEAGREYEKYFAMSVQQLLIEIRAGRLGLYYQIWQALGDKADKSACLVLWEFLRDNPAKESELQRYHCAGALFKLLDAGDEFERIWRPQVQWGHEGEEKRQQSLQKLKKLI
ncbi:MAG TPA: hypothetical protein ENN77_00065 [Candidatus Wirthbacteria bacterium]|nr:hypothetical protein [Candidatus Wirthbacteria bacterium]